MLNPIGGLSRATLSQEGDMAPRKRSSVDNESFDRKALVCKHRVGLVLIAPDPS
jgi:hypothetical protein